MKDLLTKEELTEMREKFVQVRLEVCRLEKYAENQDGFRYLNEAWNLIYEAQKSIERDNK